MAMVLINETPTEVGSGADEIIRLRAENAELREELACTIDILEQTRSQLAAAQVDAKRYRWLRDTQEGKTVRIMDRREWDKAIDEAIRKEKTE